MAWRGERWADIVARAASAEPHRKRGVETEDRAALAERARPWAFANGARLVVGEGSLSLGVGLDSVELALAQIYHVEPVDPWPSLAIGWVDRGQSYTAVLTPEEPAGDPGAFASAIDELVARHGARLALALSRGWLDVPVEPWERVEALPGERDEGPAMRGYRMAPEAPDPIVARRKTAAGAPSLWTWVWARLRPAPRRIDPIELVLTRRFLYARTRAGDAVRIPASTLRLRRRVEGDAIYVFGRNTELLLVHQDGCELAAALEQRTSG